MDDERIPFLPAWRMWAAAQPEDSIRAHVAAVLEELETAWVDTLSDPPTDEVDAIDRALIEYGELRRAVIERWRAS